MSFRDVPRRDPSRARHGSVRGMPRVTRPVPGTGPLDEQSAAHRRTPRPSDHLGGNAPRRKSSVKTRGSRGARGEARATVKRLTGKGVSLGVLCMLAVGCGGADQARTTAPATTAPAPPPAPAAAKPKPKAKARTAKTYVIVVDGDVNRRIPGARVRIGHDTAYTKRKGGISFQLRRGSSWFVRFGAPGFTP